MLNRRTLALLLGTVALSASTLVACGFDAATDRPYTPAAGVNDQTADVDVLSAVIVSTEPGAGTFVASVSNNEQDAEASLDSISPAGGASLQAAEFEPVQVPPGGFVNLADEGGIEVTGDFEAGDFVDVTIGLGNGERLAMSIPVVSNAGDFAGLDGPAPEPSAEPSAPTETADTETE